MTRIEKALERIIKNDCPFTHIDTMEVCECEHDENGNADCDTCWKKEYKKGLKS